MKCRKNFKKYKIPLQGYNAYNIASFAFTLIVQVKFYNFIISP